MKLPLFLVSISLAAACGSALAADAGKPVYVADANAILNGFDEHGTVDFGGDGAGRRIVHVARKRGQPWHLIVYAQRSPGRWQMTADQEVAENPAKGLQFVGTADESEEAPALRCRIDGKPGNAFGFLKPQGAAGFKHVMAGREVVWTLDANDKPVSMANSRVECGGKRG